MAIKSMMITSSGWNLVRINTGKDEVDIVFQVRSEPRAQGDGLIQFTVPMYIPNVNPDSITKHYVFETEQKLKDYVNGVDTCATCYEIGEHTFLSIFDPTKNGQLPV